MAWSSTMQLHHQLDASDTKSYVPCANTDCVASLVETSFVAKVPNSVVSSNNSINGIENENA